jgi:hypothetical protein
MLIRDGRKSENPVTISHIKDGILSTRVAKTPNQRRISVPSLYRDILLEAEDWASKAVKLELLLGHLLLSLCECMWQLGNHRSMTFNKNYATLIRDDSKCSSAKTENQKTPHYISHQRRDFIYPCL